MCEAALSLAGMLCLQSITHVVDTKTLFGGQGEVSSSASFRGKHFISEDSDTEFLSPHALSDGTSFSICSEAFANSVAIKPKKSLGLKSHS